MLELRRSICLTVIPVQNAMIWSQPSPDDQNEVQVRLRDQKNTLMNRLGEHGVVFLATALLSMNSVSTSMLFPPRTCSNTSSYRGKTTRGPGSIGSSNVLETGKLSADLPWSMVDEGKSKVEPAHDK